MIDDWAQEMSQPTARGLQAAVIRDLNELFQNDRYKTPLFLTASELDQQKPDGEPNTWTDSQKAFWEAFQLDYNRHRMAAPTAYAQDLPLRELVSPMPPPENEEDVETELEPPKISDESNEEDPFPYIIVRLYQGGIEAPNSPHRISLALIIGIYDDDPHNVGHIAVLEIMERILRHYRENPALDAFSFAEPINWYLQDEPSWPYYFGVIDLAFDAPAPQITQGEEFA